MGKLRYVQAARQCKEAFLRLYPEEGDNPVMNEYLAYMAVLGERVDKKRLTEVEAEYELARKESELAQRGAMRAQAATQAAAAKALEDSAARTAAEHAAGRKASADAAAFSAQLEAQRLETERLEAARQEAAQLESCSSASHPCNRFAGTGG